MNSPVPANGSDDGSSLMTTRLLPVAPELVFRAYREPALLARWWGPNGFRNEFHEFNFQPGGAWRLDKVVPNRTHEQMGFHEGWGICAEQLAELAARL